MKRDKDSKLTPADMDACDRLRALWELRPKNVTQDTVGELMGGITQGAVSQHLTHRSRLNYRAVMAQSELTLHAYLRGAELRCRCAASNKISYPIDTAQ